MDCFAGFALLAMTVSEVLRRTQSAPLRIRMTAILTDAGCDPANRLPKRDSLAQSGERCIVSPEQQTAVERAVS